jgi:hypothetical protein
MEEDRMPISSKKIVVYKDSKGNQKSMRVRASRVKQLEKRKDIEILAVKDEINVK